MKKSVAVLSLVAFVLLCMGSIGAAQPASRYRQESDRQGLERARQILLEKKPSLNANQLAIAKRYVELNESIAKGDDRKTIAQADSLFADITADIAKQGDIRKSEKAGTLWKVFSYDFGRLPYLAANIALLSDQLKPDEKIREISKQLPLANDDPALAESVCNLYFDTNRFKEPIRFIEDRLGSASLHLREDQRREYELLLAGAYLRHHVWTFRRTAMDWVKQHPGRSGPGVEGMEYDKSYWLKAAAVAREGASRAPERYVQNYLGLFQTYGSMTIDPKDLRDLYVWFNTCADKIKDDEAKAKVKANLEKALKEIPDQLEVYY